MYLTPATTTCAGARTGNQPSCGIRRCLHKASFPCEGGVGGGRRAYPGASEPGRIAGVHVAGDGGDLGNLRREARRVRPRIALEVVDARRSDHARFKEVIVDVCLPRHGSLEGVDLPTTTSAHTSVAPMLEQLLPLLRVSGRQEEGSSAHGRALFTNESAV